MRQTRVNTGKLFEQSLVTDEWVLKSKNPKPIWSGSGRSVYDKIKNIGFNHLDFQPLEGSKWGKCDIVNIHDGREREIKKYKIDDIKKWKLYSEPFFKVSRRNQLNKINKDEYNNFLKSFYNHNISNGFFDNIVSEMTKNCEGIHIIGEFIPINKFEFRTILSENEWKGFHRIQIEFKLKDCFI